MAANPEYLAVLSEVVTCIRKGLHDAKLPDLTPQEVTDWLHSITVEDLSAIWEQHDGHSKYPDGHAASASAD